jgi:hypothetical protein
MYLWKSKRQPVSASNKLQKQLFSLLTPSLTCIELIQAHKRPFLYTRAITTQVNNIHAMRVLILTNEGVDMTSLSREVH